MTIQQLVLSMMLVVRGASCWSTRQAVRLPRRLQRQQQQHPLATTAQGSPFAATPTRSVHLPPIAARLARQSSPTRMDHLRLKSTLDNNEQEETIETALDWIKNNEDTYRRKALCEDEEEFAMFTKRMARELKNLGVVSTLDLHRSIQQQRDETRAALLAFDATLIASDLDEMYSAPEYKLDGRVLTLNSYGGNEQFGHDKCNPEIRLAVERFTKDALCYDGPDFAEQAGQRPADIVLVIGPSGAGKTFFSLLALPFADHVKRSVTIYTEGHFLDQSKRVPEQSAEAAIVELGNKIQKRLKKAATTFSEEEMLDMGLTLVIDQASALREMAGDYDFLHRIWQEIDKLARYPRLIIAGIGLPEVTAGLCSDTQVRKYRPRPWTYKQVEAVVNAAHHHYSREDRDTVLRLIKSQPLYQRLATNARAAFALIDVLFQRSKWDGDDVNGVVHHVASSYIANNILKSMEQQRRRLLVRNILEILQESSRRRGEAYFPRIDSDSRYLATYVHALLDFNVDSRNDEATLMFGSLQSVSISPCLSIILLALLDASGAFGKSWSEFALVAALHELCELVLEMDESLLVRSGVKLLVSRTVIPDRRHAPLTFNLPYLSSNVVFVNDPRAFFADVIAPFRLSRVKSVSDARISAPLVIGDFVKLGIVEPMIVDGGKASSLSNAVHLNGALVSAMASMWKKSASDQIMFQQAVSLSQDTLMVAETTSPRQLYPICGMVGELPTRMPKSLEYIYDKGTCQLKSRDGGQIFHCQDSLDAVQAVFHTNGCSFSLVAPMLQKQNEGAQTQSSSSGSPKRVVVVEIKPEDVDFQGFIINYATEKAILEVLQLGQMQLRAGITLRFLFATQ